MNQPLPRKPRTSRHTVDGMSELAAPSVSPVSSLVLSASSYFLILVLAAVTGVPVVLSPLGSLRRDLHSACLDYPIGGRPSSGVWRLGMESVTQLAGQTETCISYLSLGARRG
ncbi:hypothetical protein MTO96_021981 [Rhipicephalus appendiculatus]